MADLFTNGRIVDVILVIVALEALALLGWRLRRGHGPSPAALIANLASGASLMLALRAALTQAGWELVAGLLLVSLAAHLADLCLRFRDDAARSLGRGREQSTSGTSSRTAAFTARP